MRDKVFISYRRDDARYPATMLYERLVKALGKGRVFMDVDTIRRGQDFRAVLKEHLDQTKAMLVVIGPSWASLADNAGRRRLDDPADFVRMEVAEALKSASAVIPVLVDGAALPGPDELPDDMADLRFRQLIELRPNDFAHDARLLDATVTDILKGERRGFPWKGAAAALLVAVLGVGAAVMLGADGAQDGSQEGGAEDAAPPAVEAPETPQIAEAPAETPPPSDRDAWRAVRASEDPAAIAGFLDEFPGSAFAGAAAELLDTRLREALAAPANADDPAEAALGVLRLREAYARHLPSLGRFDAASTRVLDRALDALAAAYDRDGLVRVAAAAAGAPLAEDVAARIAAVEAGLAEAQRELTRLGLYDGAVDGIWGDRSAAALRAFEERAGLSVDGALAEGDLAALGAAPTPPDLTPVGETFQECDGCPEMVVVPAGRFTMGSPEGEAGRDDDEGPQREVTIAAPFAIGVYEITFDQWAVCVADGYCQSNTEPDDAGWGRGDRPVINVSWNDITGEGGFLDWLNWKATGDAGAGLYRLPSEAEWEYAARAGSTTRFSFGDSDAALGDYAWYGSNSGARTHPVGGKAPNSFGLYDVHGNVWEWVEDCWRASYSGAPRDGSAWMEANSGDCSRAVLRGGSWGNGPGRLRSANRSWDPRVNRNLWYGFRVARTIISP